MNDSERFGTNCRCKSPLANLDDRVCVSKQFEGYFRFICLECGEFRATVNPRNNLAHCFSCGRNFNNIDLLMTLGYDFREQARAAFGIRQARQPG